MVMKTVRIDLGDPEGLTLDALTGGIEARVAIKTVSVDAVHLNGTQYSPEVGSPSSILFPTFENQTVVDGTYLPTVKPTLYRITVENGDIIELYLVRWDFRDNRYHRLRPERTRVTLELLDRYPRKWPVDNLFVSASVQLEDR